MWGVGTDSVSLPIPPGIPNSIHVLLVQCWNRRHALRWVFFQQDIGHFGAAGCLITNIKYIFIHSLYIFPTYCEFLVVSLALLSGWSSSHWNWSMRSFSCMTSALSWRGRTPGHARLAICSSWPTSGTNRTSGIGFSNSDTPCSIYTYRFFQHIRLLVVSLNLNWSSGIGPMIQLSYDSPK